MASPYIQVALMYIRRLLGRGKFFLIAFLLLAFFSRHASSMHLLLLLMPLLLVKHVVTMFADWRAHLTPNFRRVHAVVAAVATLVVILVLPAMLARLTGWSALAAISFAVFPFGTFLWLSARGLATPRGGPLLTMVAILFAVPYVRFLVLRQELIRFLSGQLELQAVALLCMGLVMILLGGMQLCRLDDDVARTQDRPRGSNPWQWLNRCSAPGTDLPKIDEGTVTNWLVFRWRDGRIERLAEHARLATMSRWSAACRWRVGMPSGWKSWLLGVGAVVAAPCAIWVDAKRELEPSAFFFLTFLVLLILCPSIVSLSQLIPRSFLLGYEIMLPVERGTYLREVVLAAAISHLRTWGGMYTGFMLWWFITAHELLHLGLMVNVLACSALAQIGLFGVGLCLISMSKPYSPLIVVIAIGALFGVVGPAIAVVLALMGVSLRDSLWPLAGTGLFAIFGLLLTHGAYRRWLVADFD